MTTLGKLVVEFLHGDTIAQAEADFHERLKRMKWQEKVYASAQRVAKTMRPEAANELLRKYDRMGGE